MSAENSWRFLTHNSLHNKGLFTGVLIRNNEAILINAPIAFMTCICCVFEALKKLEECLINAHESVTLGSVHIYANQISF